MIEAYFVHLLIFIGIYSILALSLNIAIGYTGLLNLGHIAFFGVGAYTSAILSLQGVPYFLSLIAAGLLASLFGYLLTKATGKLKGDYLALATLGFSFVISSVLLNWTSLTRGPLGIPGIPRPSFLGLTIQSNGAYLIFVIIIALLSGLIIKKIVNSSFGRLLQATRDDEIQLRIMGKNTLKLKYKAMMLSAFFAGIAGSLLAHYLNFIDPSSFSLQDIVFILTIVIVGGLASLKGSLIATFVIVLIPEVLRFITIPSHLLGPARQIIYALVLLAILLFRPRGIFGRVDLK